MSDRTWEFTGSDLLLDALRRFSEEVGKVQADPLALKWACLTSYHAAYILLMGNLSHDSLAAFRILPSENGNAKVESFVNALKKARDPEFMDREGKGRPIVISDSNFELLRDFFHASLRCGFEHPIPHGLWQIGYSDVLRTLCLISEIIGQLVFKTGNFAWQHIDRVAAENQVKELLASIDDGLESLQSDAESSGRDCGKT